MLCVHWLHKLWVRRMVVLQGTGKKCSINVFWENNEKEKERDVLCLRPHSASDDEALFYTIIRQYYVMLSRGQPDQGLTILNIRKM